MHVSLIPTLLNITCIRLAFHLLFSRTKAPCSNTLMHTTNSAAHLHVGSCQSGGYWSSKCEVFPWGNCYSRSSVRCYQFSRAHWLAWWPQRACEQEVANYLRHVWQASRSAMKFSAQRRFEGKLTASYTQPQIQSKKLRLFTNTSVHMLRHDVRAFKQVDNSLQLQW
jgi:hypothetical protein